MKKLYFLFVLSIAWLARTAQAQTTDPVRQKLDNIFANIDKSQVPTGRLLEAAVPLGPVASFDGLLLDDTSRTTMTAWCALYATAATARVAGVDTLPGLLAFNQRVQAAGAGAILLAVQYMPYASIRPDAFRQNLLTAQNEQLYDVSGRSQSPYQTRTLFAAAPSREYAASNTVRLMLPRSRLGAAS